MKLSWGLAKNLFLLKEEFAMSANAIATAKKVENEMEEKAMSLLKEVQRAVNKVAPILANGVITDELSKKGYSTRLSSPRIDERDLRTVYYISDSSDYCYVELERNENVNDDDGRFQFALRESRFFIMDKDLVQKINYAKLQIESNKRYPKLSEEKDFSTRRLHRVALETAPANLNIIIKGFEVDHMTTNTAIMIRETLRTCTRTENVKNMLNTCTSRINTERNRVEIKMEHVSPAQIPALEDMGFHSEKVNRKRLMVSDTLPEDEMYELAVKASKLVDGEMGYNPFWDLNYDKGHEVFVYYKMLGKITKEEMCLYNVAVVKATNEILWKYAQAMYRLYGKDVFRKPKCAV